MRRGNFRDTLGFVLTLSPSSPATLSYFSLSSQLSGILYFVCFVLFCYFVLFVCFPKTPLAIANYWPYHNLSYWHQVNLLILSCRGTLPFLCRQAEERGGLWLTHASIQGSCSTAPSPSTCWGCRWGPSRDPKLT